jgi:8-oxo-dGTP diphosphatase
MWIIQKEDSTANKKEIEVTCALIMDGEHVLVTQRSEQMPHPMKWEFPGGKLLSGETPESCIKREIREELGIVISVRELLPSVKHTYGKEIIKLIPFICQWVDGEIQLSEHMAYQWVHLHELQFLDWLEADLEIMNLLKNKYLPGRS